MPDIESIVFVIDDDPSFRRSTERLLCSAGLRVRTFNSAREFLRTQLPDLPACVVLDIRMPGMSGLELQQEMARTGLHHPIIFMTAHGEVRTSVQAMKAGAVEFLTKPFCEQELLGAITEAIRRDCAEREKLAQRTCLQNRYQQLTPREREVMVGVVAGMLNKQIAAEEGITEKTVKFHRAHIMRKMQVTSVAELVRLASQLDTPSQIPVLA